MEPPGTAPGSDSLITRAFMSIVPKDIPYLAGASPDDKSFRKLPEIFFRATSRVIMDGSQPWIIDRSALPHWGLARVRRSTRPTLADPGRALEARGVADSPRRAPGWAAKRERVMPRGLRCARITHGGSNPS